MGEEESFRRHVADLLTRAASTTVVMEGFMKKKSPKAVLGLHAWQERYPIFIFRVFVLASPSLSFYKSLTRSVLQSLVQRIKRLVVAVFYIAFNLHCLY